MKTITLEYDQQMVDQLIQQRHRNFYYNPEHLSRFDSVSHDTVGENGQLTWVDDTISAQIVYQFHIKNNIKAALLLDGSDWCIWLDVPLVFKQEAL